MNPATCPHKTTIFDPVDAQRKLIQGCITLINIACTGDEGAKSIELWKNMGVQPMPWVSQSENKVTSGIVLMPIKLPKEGAVYGDESWL